MTRTSYQASGAHALGWSVHPYAQTLIPEPLPDTAAMAPAGQVWSTVADLATYCTFLLEGHDDVLPAARLAEAFTPQAGEEATRAARYAHGLGFQVFPGGAGTLVGHSGSMPGFHAICLVDRTRRTGVVGLVNATGGVPVAAFGAGAARRARAVRADAAAGLATQRERAGGLRRRARASGTGAPRPTSSPARAATWSPAGATSSCGASPPSTAGSSAPAATTRGRSCTSYAASDGSVSHLDVGTFILTREPYEPGAPIPGGHPPLG